MVGGTALPKYKKALPWVILSCKLFLNEFLTSTYVRVSVLLEASSQLVACQLTPIPFSEHPCTRGCQTGHRNKPWENHTIKEWTVKVSSVVS